MRHCYVLSVFTRDGIGGNPLGVVTDISGLDQAAMQAVATDLGFSETVFLDWREKAVPAARIFTPGCELPFAGHPLVGLGWLLNEVGPGGLTTIRCEIAEVPFRTNGAEAWIDAPYGQPVEKIDVDSLPIDGVSSAFTVLMPFPYHVVELDNPALVAEAGIPALPGSVYLWAWENGQSVKARFFASDLGVVEDPATGSAAVALAAVLGHMGMRFGAAEVHQGDEVGAPSTIVLDWSPDGVTIGGGVRRIGMKELAV